MARFFCSTLVLIGLVGIVHAQTYFQQDVAYDISVRLDDEMHELHGDWMLQYTNNSPDTLDFLYIHLWPNAYSQKNTALGRQLLRQGNTQFYFAEEDKLGGIDSLAFQQDGQFLSIESTKLGPDVVKLPLAQSLLPGTSTSLKTPFRVRLPKSFSRLGHVETSYQLTQWYPKPAVYDREGWHPMPYLDNGEFYSEFGTFDVTITLPENYLVAATGELQEEKELDWLRMKSQARISGPEVGREESNWQDFPPSSASTKTIGFHAEDVHDFAWFADKRWYVRHDTLQLTPERTIDVWAFHTTYEKELWTRSIEYMKRATRFYSKLVGEYPYPQVTAVQSPRSAGGGMEYPMITLIGKEYTPQNLDGVLTHEIGHNWFYGILGTNERDYAWMDEGFNSYYDHLYESTYYPDEGNPSIDDQYAYRYYNTTGFAQPANTTSEAFREYNYWTGAYSIPAAGLAQLKHFVGEDRFNAAMQAYFDEWKFKHPQPADVQVSLEKTLGVQLDWLFAGIIGSIEQQDYQIVSVQDNGNDLLVKVKNKGQIAAPFPLVVNTAQEQRRISQWYRGFVGEQELRILKPRTEITGVSIDPDYQTMEINRQNDHWRMGLLSRFEPPALMITPEVRSEKTTTLQLLPIPSYNQHDGFMLGLGLSNSGLMPKSFEWVLLPQYGFTSNELVGFAGAQHRWWPRSSSVREVALKGSFRTYHFRTFEAEDVPLRYQRFSPGLDISFRQHPTRGWRQSLHWRSIYLRREQAEFNQDGLFLGTIYDDQWIHEVGYRFKRKRVLSPIQGSLFLEQSNYQDAFGRDQDYLKLRFELAGKVMYERDRSFHWRFFIGRFLSNSLSESSFVPANAFSLFDRGEDDYRFDNLYLDRSAGEDWGRQQLGQRAGGLRAPVPASFPIGRSNVGMVSANFSLDLPFTPEWLPLKPYLDAGSYRIPSIDEVNSEFLWVGGAALEWLDGQVGIYAPLFGSGQIMDRLAEQGGLIERIAIRVQLRDLMPWMWKDQQEVW